MKANIYWIKYRSALLLSVAMLALLAIVYIVTTASGSLHQTDWLLAISLGVTFLALAFSLKLILWRKVLTGKQTAIVPDQLLSDFKTVTDALYTQESGAEKCTAAVAGSMNLVIKTSTATTQSIADIKEALEIFQTSLTKKDAEIDRLKKGADAEVFRRFLNRFVRVHRALQEELDDAKNSEDMKVVLSDIQVLLEDALYDSGVEQFEPTLHTSLSKAEYVAKQPQILATRDKELDLTIAAVNKPGFILRTPDGSICIQEATVTIYKFKQQQVVGQ